MPTLGIILFSRHLYVVPGYAASGIWDFEAMGTRGVPGIFTYLLTGRNSDLEHHIATPASQHPALVFHAAYNNRCGSFGKLRAALKEFPEANP